MAKELKVARVLIAKPVSTFAEHALPSPFEGRATHGHLRMTAKYDSTQTHPALSHLLDEHADGAAAGQTDIPGGFIGDAKLKHLRFAAGNHIERLGHDGAFDATAGNRTQKAALIVDHKMRPGRPWRGAPGFHHGGQRDAVTGPLPLFGGLQDIVIAVEHGGVLK